MRSTSIRALIVEDEALAADKLQRQLLGLHQRIEVAAWVQSVQGAVDFLRQQAVDLIFLDIQLEDGNSFALFEQVSVDTPVVFTTAYDEFALQAFSVNSVDYLLKPFSQSDLQRAVDKFEKWQAQAQPTLPDYQAMVQLFRQQMQPPHRERFMVSVGEHLRSIPATEAAYFFAEQKYVFLVRPDGTQHIVDFTLDQLEKELDARQFFRINRKYLVQLSAIQEMVQWTKGRVKLHLQPPPSEETIVAVGRAADFRHWLGR